MRLSVTRGAPMGEVVLLASVVKEAARPAASAFVRIGRSGHGSAAVEQRRNVALRCVGVRYAGLERRAS